jgi:hypothetical protein
MPLTLSDARILVISQNQVDSDNIREFMQRMPFDLDKCRFVVDRLVQTDDFDFAIFNAMILPRINRDTTLTPEDEGFLRLFRDYLSKPIRYVVYYGEFLHDLDKERCPSANSKFTLFARIRELVDFINSYKTEVV